MVDAVPNRGPVSRATMKDVAALARVSLKTVSRVINEEPTVNVELVERVRRAASQLHYQPHFGASALRRRDGRSSTIAVLLEDLSNPFSAVIYRVVEEMAIARGVSVLGGSFDEDPKRERELTLRMSRYRVDGVIIAPASRDHQYLRQEQLAGIPFVFIDRPPHLLDADAVLSDSRVGTRQAVQHLITHGHRRIAFLGDLTTIFTAEERFEGYREALASAGLSVDPQWVVRDLRTVEAAHEAAGALLDSRDAPTAFFTGRNPLTVGTVRAIRARGLQQETAVVGCDDFLLADLLEPAITVVAQDPVAIAREAATLLFARIDGDDGPSQKKIIETSFIIRGSGEIRPTRYADSH
jgi:LacI family transcriptional regulator